MKKQPLLNTLATLLLYLTFALGVAFLILLPRLLPQILFGEDIRTPWTPVYVSAMLCWALGAVCGLFILSTLLRMMKSVQADPFIRANVRRLRDMGYAALVMAIFTLVSELLYFRPMLLLILTAELLCALFSLVLRGVFEKAVEYREENALTI